MSKLICTTTVLAAMLGVLYLLCTVQVVLPGWWGYPLAALPGESTTLMVAVFGMAFTVVFFGVLGVALLAAAYGICTWLRTLAGVEKP